MPVVNTPTRIDTRQVFENGRIAINDADIVVWVQFGLQHIPRVEDFPVI
jgi:Cu2+-containing amine oxidase